MTGGLHLMQKSENLITFRANHAIIGLLLKGVGCPNHMGIVHVGFDGAVYGQITIDFGTTTGARHDHYLHKGDLGKFSGIKEA